MYGSLTIPFYPFPTNQIEFVRNADRQCLNAAIQNIQVSDCTVGIACGLLSIHVCVVNIHV